MRFLYAGAICLMVCCPFVRAQDQQNMALEPTVASEETQPGEPATADTTAQTPSQQQQAQPVRTSTVERKAPPPPKPAAPAQPSSRGTTFKQNDNFAQGGIGVVLPGVPGHMTIPPVGAGFEYGAHDLFSAGVFFALSGSREENGANHMIFSLALEGNFHPFNLPFIPEFPLRERLDAYAGVLGGANIITNEDGRLLWGVLAGCRYYFNDYFALYAEAGRGIGFFHVGVTVKL